MNPNPMHTPADDWARECVTLRAQVAELVAALRKINTHAESGKTGEAITVIAFAAIAKAGA